MAQKIILTTMIMLENEKGEILVENRVKSDWPGLTFPGGHVEDDEDIIQGAIREFSEETGLTLLDIKNVGYIEWNVIEEKIRHLSILFKSNKYIGTIHSSKEGKVFFVKKKDINNYPLSNDFDKILKIMFKD